MGEQKVHSRCIACKRKLEDPKYKMIGFGPICYKKYLKKPKAKVVQIEMDI
jgi:hypothetical protein